MEGLECGRLPVERAEALSQRQRVGETLMLGLRQAEGVGEQEVEALCGLAAREVFEDEIEELCAEGLLMAAEGGLRIPVDKWLVSNEVLARFAA
jgi:coproporphyrinogen III oxidase-like Fe-S oxidoreductase